MKSIIRVGSKEHKKQVNLVLKQVQRELDINRDKFTSAVRNEVHKGYEYKASEKFMDVMHDLVFERARLISERKKWDIELGLGKRGWNFESELSKS